MATAIWDEAAGATIMAGAEAVIAVGASKPEHMFGGRQAGGLLSSGASFENPFRRAIHSRISAANGALNEQRCRLLRSTSCGPTHPVFR